MKEKKVLMAMSGGIDSTISAILLKEQGYDVIGITMKTWDYSHISSSNRKDTGCCNLDSFNDARQAAVEYGFPHYILDLKKEFSGAVIDDFIEAYMNGQTPNPCIQCNTFIKWNALLKKADALGCTYIATGHYAKIFFENNRYFISKAKDSNKDQSYVLWGLSQEVMQRTLFPLHNYEKTEVRQLAKDFGLEDLAKKKESYEICFIPDNDYRNFLKNNAPNYKQRVSKGSFQDTDGNTIGQHDGYPFFTIGQRKKLGTAFGKPMYVTEIDAENNIVTVGAEKDLMKEAISLNKVNMMKYASLKTPMELVTKIRYRDIGSHSLVKEDNGSFQIVFKDKVKAPAAGQSAVFYEGNDVVGGGFISKT